MDLSFIKGLIKGLEIQGKFDRKNKIKEAYELAKAGYYEEALNLLENVKLSCDEKSVANMLGYLLKACCYTALGYKQSARNSINVILNASRFSLNPYYQYTLSDIKEEALRLKEENDL